MYMLREMYCLLCIRSLREKWEAFSDQLSESQRQMEVSLVQLSSYEDSLNQFYKWLTDTQAKVKAEGEVKATLPEKKVQLQSHKVIVFDGGFYAERFLHEIILHEINYIHKEVFDNLVNQYSKGLFTNSLICVCRCNTRT